MSQYPENTNILSEIPSKIMDMEEFLGHFYTVVQEHIRSHEMLEKVFNLYVVQTNKNRAGAEQFKARYLASVAEYSKQQNEVGFVFHLLQSKDEESAIFVIEAKKRLLTFYDFGPKNLQISLDLIPVPIKDWLNLLKSFSFFQGGISKKLETFKRLLLEENEDLSNVNGLDFVKALLNFSSKINSEDDEHRRITRKNTNPVRFSTAFSNLKLEKSSRSNDLITGKVSQKFGQQIERGFLKQAQNGKEEQIKDLERFLYKEARVKRQVQQTYYSQIDLLKRNSEKYDNLHQTVESMRNMIVKLTEVAKKHGVPVAQDKLQLAEKSSREDLALDLYSKMRMIGF